MEKMVGFETLPGWQMQVDQVEIKNNKDFLAVLWLQWVLRKIYK